MPDGSRRSMGNLLPEVQNPANPPGQPRIPEFSRWPGQGASRYPVHHHYSACDDGRPHGSCRLSCPPMSVCVPCPYYGWVYAAPIVIPGELIYGPIAYSRTIGLTVYSAPRVPRIVIINAKNPRAEEDEEIPAGVPGRGPGRDAPLNLGPDDEAENPADKKPAIPNPAWERKLEAMRRMIQTGDANFAQQRFADALRIYRSAADQLPGQAEPFARQGFAYVAIGNYEQAFQCFKRAVALDPLWPKSGFRLDRLYGEFAHAKEAHRNALRQAVEADPQNGALRFVLAVHLFFDDQREEAEKSFWSALRLSRGDLAHIQVFLPEP